MADLEKQPEPEEKLQQQQERQQDEQQQQQDEPKDAASAPPKFVYAAFNAAAWIVIVHELLERFSFYGMKGILTYYLLYLGFDDDAATIIYHLFTGISYLTPLIGTYMSDNYFGRYKTVVVLGVVYLVGHLLMPLTALANNKPGPLVAMFVLALGTGGIKPCVASFGGDQIEPGNEVVLDAFFAVFYMSINVGAFVSQLLTPILREQVQCIDGYCYPLAFGVPAFAFVLCYILFLAGTKTYNIYPKPSEPMLNKAVKAVFAGKLKKGAQLSDEVPSDGGQTEREFIDDVRRALRVCFLFLPFPIYWALFDQQGSRWVLQGRKMDGYISEGFSLTADQMQSVNPLLIVFIVPIFNNIVYPLLTKFNVMTSATSRIFVGYLICSACFVLTGFIQLLVDGAVPTPLEDNKAQLQLYNGNDCQLRFEQSSRLTAIGSRQSHSLELTGSSNVTVNFRFSTNCGSDHRMMPASVVVPTGKTSLLILRGDRVSKALPVPHQVSNTRLRLVAEDPNGLLTSASFGPGCSPASNISMSGGFFANEYCELGSRISAPLLLNGEQQYTVSLTEGATIKFVTVFAALNADNRTYSYQQIVDRGLYPLHLLLQLPQYLLMCISEVLFSVTAMAYAYSEAPESLRALLQSAYLVSIFLGNMIVIAVAAAPTIPQQAYEFFLFAALVFIGGFVQLLVIYYYNRMKLNSSNKVQPIEIEMEPTKESS